MQIFLLLAQFFSCLISINCQGGIKMKKTSILLLSGLIVLFASATVCYPKSIEKQVHDSGNYSAARLIQPQQSINKELADFFLKDTVIFGYTKMTEDNISFLEGILIEEKLEIKKEKAKENNNEPSIKSDTDDIKQVFQLVSNLSKLFGPDIAIGFSKPEINPEDDNNIEPPFLAVTEIKSKNYTPESIIQLFASDKEFKTEQYQAGNIHYTDLDKSEFAFTNFEGYLLLGNHRDTIIKAIENKKQSEENVLSIEKVQRALGYLPENYFAVFVTDNASIAMVTKRIDEIKKKKEEEKARKKCEEIDNEGKPPEQLYSNEESANVDSEQQKKEKVKEEIIEDDVSSEKPEEKAPQKPDMFEMFFKGFTDTTNYSATALILGDNKVEIQSFTPYSLDFIGKFNPEMQKSIEKFLSSGRIYHTARSLPVETAGFLLASNLGGIGEIINTVDDSDFQKGAAGFKFMLMAMTGLDPDSELLPLLSGQMTVAGINFEGKIEPLIIISDMPETETTIDKALESFKNMNNEKSFKIKNSKIKGIQVKTVEGDDIPVKVAFSKVNDNILFARDEALKSLIPVLNKESKTLFSSENFKVYRETSSKPENMTLYINPEMLFSLLDKQHTKKVPEEIVSKVDSFYLRFYCTEDSVLSITATVEIKD
jgi:hypothetical protein